MLEIIPTKKPLQIKTKVPSSKSYTNRALVLAALAKGKSTIKNPLESDDTKVMLSALKKLGVSVQNNSTSLVVTGTGGLFKKPKSELYLGNAGTAVRFLTALLATQNFESELTGNERMQERPISDLTDALTTWGASVKSTNATPPLKIKGPLHGGTTTVNGSISSQYLSALLISAPYAKNPTSIKVQGKLTSLPYIEMTLDTINKFGGEITNNKFKTFEIKPHQYKGIKYEVEGDASSASYPLAIAALTHGRAEITNVPVGSKQADLQFVDILKKMGCKITINAKYKSNSSPQKQPMGTLSTYEVTGPKQLKALGKIDLNHMPDSAMTVAVLCAFANGTSKLTGLGNLRVKETDRLTALKNELTKLRIEVKTGKTWIEIVGNPNLGKSSIKTDKMKIETYDDHRMAMCFAVVGSKIQGIKIKNPKCVGKTYPNFFKDLKKWGISSKQC